MSGKEKDVAIAEAKARTARTQLISTMSELQERLNPANIVSDAWRDLRERGAGLADDAVELARARPGTTIAVAASAALFVTRRPLWRVITRRIFKRGETGTPDRELGTGRDSEASIPDASEEETRL